MSLVVSASPLLAKIMLLNPVAQIIQDARESVVTSQTTTIITVFGNNWLAYLIPFTIITVMAIVSVWYFKKQSPHFAEAI